MLLRVPHDHLIDFTQPLRRQPLAEVHHQGWIKRQLFIITAGIPTEVLQVRVLLDLQCSLLIGIAIFRLNDAGAKGQPQRFGCVALAVGKQRSAPLLNLPQGIRLGFLYPTAALFQIHVNWLLEICLADLPITAAIHSCPPGARFFLIFAVFLASIIQ